jgi:hypothetical protein
LSLASATGLPDFTLFNIPKRGKIYQIATKLPNGHKIYQMAVTYSTGHRIFQIIKFQGPQKFTIWQPCSGIDVRTYFKKKNKKRT